MTIARVLPASDRYDITGVDVAADDTTLSVVPHLADLDAAEPGLLTGHTYGALVDIEGTVFGMAVTERDRATSLAAGPARSPVHYW